MHHPERYLHPKKPDPKGEIDGSMALPPNCTSATPASRTHLSTHLASPAPSPSFQIHHPTFLPLLGPKPALDCFLEFDARPYAHEAAVYHATSRSLFVTSNRRTLPDGTHTIKISRLAHVCGRWARMDVPTPTPIPFPNGGTHYRAGGGRGDGILLCAQGSRAVPGGLVVLAPNSDHLSCDPVYYAETLLDHFHGRRFNSPSDVVVHSDGSIWFTDPSYGFEQGLCGPPELPDQVYRFEPRTGDVRAVADGFGKPNGICFAPGEGTVYITDTEAVRGDGGLYRTRGAHIYAFDVIGRGGAPFLANRRLFAMAAVGVPDGIKCDRAGNVYAGCGDSVNVWNEGGVLLGKILVPGGVANFCFGEGGEMFLLNEHRVWRAQLHAEVKGALLGI